MPFSIQNRIDFSQMNNSQPIGHTQPSRPVDQTEQDTVPVLDTQAVKIFVKLLIEGKIQNDGNFTISPRRDIVAIHQSRPTAVTPQTEFFCMQRPYSNCDDLIGMIEKFAPASSMCRIVLYYQPFTPQIKDGQYTLTEVNPQMQAYVTGDASFVKSIIVPYLPRLTHILDFTLSDSDMTEFRRLSIGSVRNKVINLFATTEGTWESNYQSFELYFEGYTFALHGIGPQGPRCLFIFDYMRVFQVDLPPLTYISMVGISVDWDEICKNLLLPCSDTCVRALLSVSFVKRDIHAQKTSSPIRMSQLQHLHIYMCDPSNSPNFIQRLSAPKLAILNVFSEESIKPLSWNLNAYYKFLSHCSRTLTNLVLHDRIQPCCFIEPPKIPQKSTKDIERLLGVIPYVALLKLPMTALIHRQTIEKIKSKSYNGALLPNLVSLEASFSNADDVRDMVQSRNDEAGSSQRTSIITSVSARIPRHKGHPRPKKGKEIQGCCEIKWI